MKPIIITTIECYRSHIYFTGSYKLPWIFGWGFRSRSFNMGDARTRFFSIVEALGVKQKSVVHKFDHYTKMKEFANNFWGNP